MKQKNPQRATTHNGPYTSACIIPNKLVARSILAYEQSFSHLIDKSHKRQTIQNQMTPKVYQHGVSSRITFQYDLKDGATKNGILVFCLATFGISVLHVYLANMIYNNLSINYGMRS